MSERFCFGVLLHVLNASFAAPTALSISSFSESGIKTDVQVCYNIFNCLDLEEMADWYEEHLQVTPNLSLWNWPPSYSAKYIKRIPKLYDRALHILETHGKRFRKSEYVLDFMKDTVEDEENSKA